MAAVDQTPPSNNPFAPEAEDTPEEEPMDMAPPVESTDANQEQELPAVKSAETRIQAVPQWTNDELVGLLEVCEQSRTWESRAQSLIEEFGKNHSDDFFSTDACMDKYKRLTGESENKPANKELLSWIKQFLKRSFNERHAHGEAARLARVRRFYELTMHALNNRLTEDQISELVGIDLYNDFVTNKLTEPNREGREEWLHADLFSSKLSHEEWKNAKNPEDLINKLRTQPINKSRLRFQHHPYKLRLLEDMDNEKEEPGVQAEKQKPDEILSHGIRSPAGRRSEALASIDSVDQSIESGKSPQRKKRRRIDAVGGDLDKTPQQHTFQIKRENESPEIVFYEPNITIVSSPTRALLPPPLVVGVDAVETADSERRQLRQRKPSDAKSPASPDPNTKVEIKREIDVQDTETIQSMEVDENQPVVRPEVSDSFTQTLLSVRQPIARKQKQTVKEAKVSEATTSSRASRRSQANKKTTDSTTVTPSPTPQTPLGLPPINQPKAKTIECRHIEVQTDAQVSNSLHGHVLVFTDQPIDEKLLIKAESEFHASADKKPKKESLDTGRDKSNAGTPSAATRKRKNAPTTELKAETPTKLDGSAIKTSPKNSPKEFVALITDEQTMSEYYPEIRLPDPEEPAEEQQSTKKGKEQKEKATPARRSRRSAAASQEETSIQEAQTSAKKPANRPLQIATLQPSPSIAQEPKPGPVTPNQKTLLLSAHNLVIGHPKATEFRERVTDDVVAGYSEVVKFPMDLNTIKQMIDENKIKTLTELHDNYLLMCMNAIMFNDDGHTVNQDARELKLFCAQTIQNMRHPTMRKSAQRQSARRLTTGRAFGSGPSTSSGARPFIQQSAGDPRLQPFIRKTFVHSPNYHRVRKIKAPPAE